MSKTKDMAYHAERLFKDATLDITPGGTMIKLTFKDGSYLTILTERSFNNEQATN